ncbi:hypothetical protein BJ508DRAFT_207225 [Ascobolus immersus RN42]|uniref:ornithine decarboxylase n=1 Tax=Ascobolus immersus RN42 TaxID=1160509 RepID=A0A3N4IGU3_ASCIM|nr:hypothetical protein BJ508DRAFT_207225 [Ascobolus immersus RN42]
MHKVHEQIRDAFMTRIDGVDVDTCDAGGEDPFFVVDLGEVYRQHLRWKKNLGRVEPFYAVKCNPDPAILRLMVKLGNGFDCASKAEIDMVLRAGGHPSKIIYAQPCKTNSYIRYAKSVGVSLMTFDNADELYKIKQLYPAARLVLRIETDDSQAACQLSCKFGAQKSSVRPLLETAASLGLQVVGVSFHVGSGNEDPNAYRKCLSDANDVFSAALDYGYKMEYLDIGGGFNSEDFEKVAANINRELDGMYMDRMMNDSDFKIIAEPGRYYVEMASSLAAHVIARRTINDQGVLSHMLYLNDGVYGNFSGIMYDHQRPLPRLLKSNGRCFYNYERTPSDRHYTKYSIWGPTCDGIDWISKKCFLPDDIKTGDWLYFTKMGAYTTASATAFNGFPNDHQHIYVYTEAAIAPWKDELELDVRQNGF